MSKYWLYLSSALALGLAAPAVQAQNADGSAQARDELNRQQAEFAKHQLEQNAANQRAYEQAVQARNAAIQSAQAAYEAEKARLIREHDEAMARWQADVVACKAGQKDHCAKQ